MSQFYNDMAASVLRADYTIYLILAYLTFFRLEELTFPEYQRFIESQEPDKMSTFLSYVFDVDRLANSVKWDWIKIFDLAYVEDSMLQPIVRYKMKANRMRIEMMAKASGLAAEKEASDAKAGIPELPKKEPTVATSPRLTKPAPRTVPMPHKILQEVGHGHEKFGKEPTYLDRTSLAEIDAEKTVRRTQELEKTRRKYAESKVQPFKLHETRNSLRAARREAEQAVASQLQFESKPGPAAPVRMPTKQAEFKMNTAAYLREDSLYKRKQEEEVKLIQAYESELRDSTEYYRWQAEMQKKDAQGRKEQVERVRTLAKQSAEEARQAMDKQRDDNAELASHIKAESVEMQKQLELEVEMRRIMNGQLVKEVIAVREHAPREAQRKVREQRKFQRDAIREEMAALLAEQEEELRTEQVVREDCVKQLKAVHEVHREHVKVFDPTESVGIGLLDEMSLVEMKERLAINKERAEEAEKKRRAEIIDSRQKQRLNLRKRIENIARIRAAQASLNKESRIKDRAEEAAEAASKGHEIKEGNLKLLCELEARREAEIAQRRALRNEEERRQNAQAFGGQGTYAAEENHFSELLKGAEREVTLQQGSAQRAAKVYEATKRISERAVELNTKRTQASKKHFYATQAEDIERKRKELIAKSKEETFMKKSAFLTQREKHKAVKEKIIALNPYAHTLTEKTLAKLSVQRQKGC
jgi:hypothetical protein